MFRIASIVDLSYDACVVAGKRKAFGLARRRSIRKQVPQCIWELDNHTLLWLAVDGKIYNVEGEPNVSISDN